MFHPLIHVQSSESFGRETITQARRNTCMSLRGNRTRAGGFAIRDNRSMREKLSPARMAVTARTAPRNCILVMSTAVAVESVARR